ncbi:MAG: primosomal protein N' [Candidatus Saganbacteria bacterium]|nr:primosomal protein N' [Candidatus Saganbacteria bacterium]
MYAQVVLSYVSSFVDKPFTYLIPDSLTGKLQIGSQVIIPFGKRKEVGYIVGFLKELPEEIKGMKSIEDVRGNVPFFSADTVEAAKWMSQYYVSFFGSALRTMMIPGVESFENKKGKKRLEITPGPEPKRFSSFDHSEKTEPTRLAPSLPRGLASGYSIVLLSGPSGSGKTAFYIKSIKEALSKGLGAIILVPEISFSNQLVSAMKEEFAGKIAVIHSSVPQKELIEEWKKIYSGEFKVVLGTRTALFTPVRDLGLIIIDEEEEFTYKQEQNPKYHAREAALFIAKQKNIPVILGSGCPTVETFYKADEKKYRIIKLERKKDLPAFPLIDIVNMREENKNKFGILSKKLVAEMRAVVEKNQKIILLINRRGFAPFLLCEECGNTIVCPNCSVSLSYHAMDKSLHCSRCGFTKTVPVVCPNCMSSDVRFIGTGTQKVEREVARYFPKLKTLRLDKDITDVKKTQDVVIKMFAEGDANILIGTQMAVRTMELTKVSLAGIVSADMALGTPDFRAAESTFQMILEVAGVSKRHNIPEKVIVQTYNADHYAFACAKGYDYERFYGKEILNRRESKYPPYGQVINLMIYGKKPASGQSVAEDIAERLISLKKGIEILGPVQTSLAKVRGRSRWQILIKGRDLDIIKDELRGIVSDPKYRKDYSISVDVDPINIG